MAGQLRVGKQTILLLAVALSVASQAWAASYPMSGPAYAPGSYHCSPHFVPYAIQVIPYHSVPLMPWAVPTPAPPSASDAQVAKSDRAPAISEARAASATDSAPARPTEPGRCNVGFWNVTGRDVSLTIDGKAQALPKGHALTLSLPHRFQWQIEGREPHAETVPQEQNVYEVILRPDSLPR